MYITSQSLVHWTLQVRWYHSSVEENEDTKTICALVAASRNGQQMYEIIHDMHLYGDTTLPKHSNNP